MFNCHPLSYLVPFFRHSKGASTSRGSRRGGGGKNAASCARTFSDCVARRCRIQSPNYPGFYPRNTTCAYHVHVRRQDVPAGKHALVSVSQPWSARLAVLAQRVRKFGSEDVSLGLWSDCDSVGDTVTVYDGADADAPALIRFCRGSAIPPVISSGRDIFVVFESSPFSTPEMAAFTANGFELDVGVAFVDDGSFEHARHPRNCRFEITSGGAGAGRARRRARSRGVVRNVAHALPANSTCTYRFVGRPGEVVWLTFRKFEVVHHKEDIYRAPDCLNRMSLHDPARKSGQLREFCESSPPRLCDYSYLESFGRGSGKGDFRACVGDNETYVSWGNELSLELRAGESTAVTAVNFVVAYEFVETAQAGEDRIGHARGSGRWSCDRVFDGASYFRRRSPTRLDDFPFATPRNVFLFGRGGRTNLRCAYTFRGGAGQERVRLRIAKIGSGAGGGGSSAAGAQCSSSTEHDLLPGLCSGPDDERAPRLRIYISEVPGGGTAAPVRQHCLCEEVSYEGDVSFLSNTSTLLLEFVAENMRPDQDYDDFFLEGTFSFVHESSCQLNSVATGAGGEILLKRSTFCNDQPWVIKASQPGKYIFLKVTGSVIYQGRSDGGDLRNFTSRPRGCLTGDRIYIYTGGNVTVVCPETAGSGGGGVRSVELFSDGWARARLPSLPPSMLHQRGESREASAVTVRFASASLVGGPYLLQWLELSPDPDRADAVVVPRDYTDGDARGGEDSSFSSSVSSRSSSSCPFSCPELSGCIRAELYCDGVRHCPSGFDEREENCVHVFAPLLYMYAVAIVTVAVGICVGIAVAQRMRSRSIYRSTESLTHDDADGGDMNNVVVAAYNPGMVGANGSVRYNGEYHESLNNLAQSVSIHSNVNDDVDGGGFMVVEADVAQMPLVDENGVS